MNNIIKHINYDEFTGILGQQKLTEFLTKAQGYACVFFIAEWSVPSRLTYKRIKKICLNKANIAFVDVDLVDNIELCDHYKVTKVPHCVVIANEKVEEEIVGLDIEKLNEALLKFNVIDDNKKIAHENCPKGHKYEILKELPYPPYIDNFFFCNRCKKVDKCDEKNLILHCGECDYDLCKFCQLTE